MSRRSPKAPLTLQDNQNRHDEVNALNAFLKKRMEALPGNGSLVSYVRGDGRT